MEQTLGLILIDDSQSIRAEGSRVRVLSVTFYSSLGFARCPGTRLSSSSKSSHLPKFPTRGLRILIRMAEPTVIVTDSTLSADIVSTVQQVLQSTKGLGAFLTKSSLLITHPPKGSWR